MTAHKDTPFHKEPLIAALFSSPDSATRVVTISGKEDTAPRKLTKIDAITRGFVEQFAGILRDNPEIGIPGSTPAGRVFVRVKFRIRPGRSAPIENDCKQEIVQTLKTLDSDYTDWMVSINSEVSEAPVSIQPFRVPRAALNVAKERKPNGTPR